MKHILVVCCALFAGIAASRTLAMEKADSPICTGQTQYNWATYRGKAGNFVGHPANAVSIDCNKNGLTYSTAAMLRNPDNNPAGGDSLVFRQIAISDNSGQTTTWTAGMLHNATGIAGANHTFWYNAYPNDEPTIFVDWRSTVPLMIQQLIGATVRHKLSMEQGVLELSSTVGWSVDSQFRIFGKHLNGYGLSAGRGMGSTPSLLGDATYVETDDMGGNWAIGLQGGRMAEGDDSRVAAESRIGLHVERTLMHSDGSSTYLGSELYRMTNPGGIAMPDNFFTGTVGVIHTRPINGRLGAYIAGGFNGNSIEGVFASIETGLRWMIVKNLFLTGATGYENPLGAGLPQSDQFGYYGGIQYKFGLM